MAQTRTVKGTKVYIAPARTTEPADATAYAALTWTEITFIRSISDYGDTSNIITAQVVGDGRARKAKGTNDAGTLELTVFPDDADAGQLAVVAAFAAADSSIYPIKIVKPDRLTTGGTDSIDYMCVKVAGKRQTNGENEALATRVFMMPITTQITAVLPT